MKLKVKSLEWWMMEDPEFLESDGYTPIEPILGRDGYYSYMGVVWFEYDGKAYKAFPTRTAKQAREYFEYDFHFNDEKILPAREAEAMRVVLRTSKDYSVRKALRERLRKHEVSLEHRNTRRDIGFRIRNLNQMYE